MPGNKYNGDSHHIPGRVERLLRERELRKSGKVGIHSNESSEKNEEGFEKEVQQQRVGVRELENDVERGRRSERQEVVVGNGNGNGNGKGYRQRLLVVANRLPVSAIRKGEDSWSLEISAGGLVSALLGKFSFQHHHHHHAAIKYPPFSFSGVR